MTFKRWECEHFGVARAQEACRALQEELEKGDEYLSEDRMKQQLATLTMAVRDLLKPYHVRLVTFIEPEVTNDLEERPIR